MKRLERRFVTISCRYDAVAQYILCNSNIIFPRAGGNYTCLKNGPPCKAARLRLSKNYALIINNRAAGEREGVKTRLALQ